MKLLETTLSRSMNLGMTYGYMIISACRQLKNKDKATQKQIDDQNHENKKSTELLKHAVSAMGLSFVEVQGGYHEVGREAEEETSLFITNYLFKEKESLDIEDFIALAMDLAREFNQDSVLIYDPKFGKPAYYDKYGDIGMVFSGFKLNDLEEPYYTKFNKGGRFTFEAKENKMKHINEGINTTELGKSEDGEWILYIEDCRSANHGKDPHFEIGLINDGYAMIYVRTDDKRCEDIVNKWIKKYNIIIDDKELKTALSMKESKEKIMKKSLKEKFNGPEGWDFEDMVERYGREFMADESSDYEPFEMEMIDELFDKPSDVLQKAYFGGRYGFKNDSFNPNDEWFAFNGYANLISIDKYDLTEYLMDNIDEEDFFDYCVDNGYFDVDDED